MPQKSPEHAKLWAAKVSAEILSPDCRHMQRVLERIILRVFKRLETMVARLGAE